MNSGKYDVVYADPPWNWRSWSDKGKDRSAENHYPVMSVDDIAGLDVRGITDDNAVLFLWATYPNILDAFRVLESWGFRYRTVAFTWVKYTRSGIPRLLEKFEAARSGRIPTSEIERFLKSNFWHLGLGYFTRANPEIALLGVRGKMSVSDRGVRNLIVSPVGRHSEKPIAVYEAIERLYPADKDHPERRYLELFARARRPGWFSVGNEISGNDIREDLRIMRDRTFSHSNT